MLLLLLDPAINCWRFGPLGAIPQRHLTRRRIKYYKLLRILYHHYLGLLVVVQFLFLLGPKRVLNRLTLVLECCLNLPQTLALVKAVSCRRYVQDCTAKMQQLKPTLRHLSVMRRLQTLQYNIEFVAGAGQQ